MRLTRFYILPAGLLLALGLQSSSCSSPNRRPSVPIAGFKASRAAFNLGDEARFEYKFARLASDGQRRLLIAYAKFDRVRGEKLGEFFTTSTDEGASFGPERPLPPGSLSTFIQFAHIQGGWSAVYLSRQPYSDEAWNIFFSRLERDDATWSAPVQINDEQDSTILRGGGDFSFIQRSESEIYCLWTDKRRGFQLVFFSASHDGGRTWSPNQAVEHDFREGMQFFPRLVGGEGGRLLAFWQDGRDRQTLFDIRCSYSDDGGQHWSPSQKINDDQIPVWQTEPVAVARDNRIYVAFADFREPGEEGGNDWNIYFAVSSDNGLTWSPNIRVNDVQAGVDDVPAVMVDDRGILYCLWHSGRHVIFKEIYLAYSSDGGRSWSPSVKVSEGSELAFHQSRNPILVAGRNLLFLLWEVRPGWERFSLNWITPLSTPSSESKPASVPTIESPTRTPFPNGEASFADDFSSGSQARWQVATGVWTIIDETLRGVEPGVFVPFSSFARYREPESYVFRGRFKLDPVHHQMAYLYFRANPAARRTYVIHNGFQTGVCLSIKKDDSPPVLFGPFALDGRPLAQRPFPFQNNRWYEFTLAVGPDRVDYFVDGRWMLSYKGPLELPPGELGIGGFGSAPTYFDDIVVTEQK